MLQEKRYRQLGSIQERQTDVRIVAATNRKLAQLVEQGTFRRDLYYRINIVNLELPPLCKRSEDIPILINHFIEKMNRIHGKHISGINEGALAILLKHDFPGNIRELENIIEHCFVLCNEEIITPNHLPNQLQKRNDVSSPKDTGEKAIDATLHSTEERLIRSALVNNNFNRRAAANELGIHKSTLFRKIKKLRIPLPERDGRHTQLKD